MADYNREPGFADVVCAHIVSGTRVATESNKVQRDWMNKSGATIT